MARKALHIVANQATKQVLAQLGSPLIQVAVKGRVIKGAAANTLLIENIQASKSTSLPIVAGPIARRALANLAAAEGNREVTLTGRVSCTASGNVMVLDGVGNAQSLPIIADASTRCILADLAKAKGETMVKAKIVEQAGNKILVLTTEGKGKKK